MDRNVNWRPPVQGESPPVQGESPPVQVKEHYSSLRDCLYL